MKTLLLSLRSFNSRRGNGSGTTVRPWPCAHDNQLLPVFNPSEATKLSQGWGPVFGARASCRQGEGFQPSEASTRGAQQLTRGDSLSRRGRPRAFQAGHDHAGWQQVRPARAASTAAFRREGLVGSQRGGGADGRAASSSGAAACRSPKQSETATSGRTEERAERRRRRRADSTPLGFVVDDGPEKEKEGRKGPRERPGGLSVPRRGAGVVVAGGGEARLPGGGRGTRRRWTEDVTLPSEHGTAGRCSGRRETGGADGRSRDYDGPGRRSIIP